MNKFHLLILQILLIFSTLSNDQCTLQDPQKIDCGYMGIDQEKCEAKSCCWRPTSLRGDVPWCFFPAGDNPCQTLNWKGTDGPGFDSTFYNKMNALYQANLNIQSSGAVVASPDRNTPGGSYYYHWMRDGALSMRTYMEINDMKLDVIDQKMKAYVQWVSKVQAQVDPNGFDIRINPKFQIPGGQAYVGGWCRPQTDGPGLRSGTLLLYTKALVLAGRKDDAARIIPLIKADLEWVIANWTGQGCDLWQQVRSNDFYWGRTSYIYTLNLCSDVLASLDDHDYATKCLSAKSIIAATLDTHWNSVDKYIYQSQNRPKDGCVLHAISSFNILPLTDDKIAQTIEYLSTTFCSQYTINQQDNKANLPGMLIGRYPGDSYAGGNPWQLLTAALGKLFYQSSISVLQNGFLKTSHRQSWMKLLSVTDNNDVAIASAMLQAGDAVMSRLYKYVKDGDGHITEQIDKENGDQKSAKDLTWSFANILSALKTRQNAQKILQQYYLSQ